MSEIDLLPEHRLEIYRQKLSDKEKEIDRLKIILNEIKEYVNDGSNASIFYIRSLLRRYGF